MFPPDARPGSEPKASFLDIVQLLVFAVLVSALCYLMLNALFNAYPPTEVLTQTPLETAPTVEAGSEARTLDLDYPGSVGLPAQMPPNNEG